MRILIADDNGPVRHGVIDILGSHANLTVCGEATNGLDAIEKARTLLPDLVLLDISMPGINGIEVARRLRRECSATKIVMMSQHDPIYMMPLALEAGAQSCVDKSRLGTDLLAAITNLCGQTS